VQTRILPSVLDTPAGREADKILRSCVHCGFCTATCPTYQQLGDELDGPRGRIYLIKDMLEGGPVSRTTQQHLDRCLSCRACETTCPSGVAFAHLADIGRQMVEQRVPRPWSGQLLRRLLLAVLPRRARFARLLALGRMLQPLLPARLARRIPPRKARPQQAEACPAAAFPERAQARKILLIEGCVQPALSPEIDAAAARVLETLSIQTLRTGMVQCCGAVEHHLNASERALQRMRANIDAWLPFLDAGAEAIVSTASACALEIREYGYLLRDDPDYADKARRISARCRDLVELLEAENLDALRPKQPARIAVHAPCTLQHGQQLQGRVERLLAGLGHQLTPVADAHLCCGSAGAYSLLQPELAAALRDDKVKALSAGRPEMFVTANIGCLHHISAGANLPVRHWITLLSDAT